MKYTPIKKFKLKDKELKKRLIEQEQKDKKEWGIKWNTSYFYVHF